jgi:hypothetical protein
MLYVRQESGWCLALDPRGTSFFPLNFFSPACAWFAEIERRAPGFPGSEREREREQGQSVVGRRSIGGYWFAGFERERERERDFLQLAFSTFLFYFFFIFFLIKKDKRCVMWVKSRTLDARIALLLHAWLVDLLKQIIWLMHICMLHLA